jgi:hypothetical protein
MTLAAAEMLHKQLASWLKVAKKVKAVALAAVLSTADRADRFLQDPYRLMVLRKRWGELQGRE